MSRTEKTRRNKGSVVAVSGGPDSVYLASMQRESGEAALLGHFNHRARGKESDEDQRFVVALGRTLGVPVESGRAPTGRTGRAFPAGFEEKARNARYVFLKEVKARRGAGKIVLGHTADDQVETILMRVFEGAGIGGLKGIPRETPDGISRPLLDTWREDILEHLRARRIPYRLDRSNSDPRFERNWIRHVLVPLLEKRYGKSVKKRIHTLGERFREIDEFLEQSARTFLKQNANVAPRSRHPGTGQGTVAVSRKSYARRAAALRKRALQLICFEHLGIAPKERLLESMDRVVCGGGPSARLALGKGAALRCRNDEAVFARPSPEDAQPLPGRAAVVRIEGPGRHEVPWGAVWGVACMTMEERKGVAAATIRRLAAEERGAAFDAGELCFPLVVDPLRAGDRIRPFGLAADKKVKEILIDRKIPQGERWGRPVLRDAKGEILWIPGVLRSSHASVRRTTSRTVILRAARGGWTSTDGQTGSMC